MIAERSDEFAVEGRLLTDVGGTIAVKVLSTPGMISMMERCCSILAFERLPDGKATVGFEVCVKHVAAAGEGAACTVHARLDEVERFSAELSKVLEHIETIGGLDLDGVEPTSHVVDVVNRLREDVPRPSLPREVALGAAPEVAADGFGVPSPGA